MHFMTIDLCLSSLHITFYILHFEFVHCVCTFCLCIFLCRFFFLNSLSWILHCVHACECLSTLYLFILFYTLHNLCSFYFELWVLLMCGGLSLEIWSFPPSHQKITAWVGESIKWTSSSYNFFLLISTI